LGGAAFAVSVGVAWLDLTNFEQYVWFSFVGAVAASARGSKPVCATISPSIMDTSRVWPSPSQTARSR